MMDGTELDEIMNEATASEVIPAVVEAAPQAEAQPRDETGKFTGKAAPSYAHDTISGEETGGAVTDPDIAAQAAVEGERSKVPLAAVQAEREKRKQTENDNLELRRQMQEMSGQIKLLNERSTQPATPAEKPKPPNFWENPDEFLAERLAPVQQTMQQQRFEMSRMLAEEKLGAEVVKAADDALGELIQANDPAVAALQAQIANSRHPYADLVAWHTKRQAMSEIGEDPAAYRERVRAELMAELGVEAATAEATPSTPTKPLVKLPHSLSKIPGAGNGSGAADLSDAGLFTDAMSGR